MTEGEEENRASTKISQQDKIPQKHCKIIVYPTLD